MNQWAWLHRAVFLAGVSSVITAIHTYGVVLVCHVHGHAHAAWQQASVRFLALMCTGLPHCSRTRSGNQVNEKPAQQCSSHIISRNSSRFANTLSIGGVRSNQVGSIGHMTAFGSSLLSFGSGPTMPGNFCPQDCNTAPRSNASSNPFITPWFGCIAR